MRFAFLSCGATALSLLAPTLVAAQPDPACTYGDPAVWDSVAEDYVGIWRLTHQAGFVVAGPMTMPFPAAGDNEEMTVALIDGVLVADHPEAQEPLVMQWADEAPWQFAADAAEDGVPAPLLSSTDVELMMGCPNSDMARLIGTSTAVIDGTQMDFTYRMLVIGADLMYGVMHVSTVAQGTPVNAWRTVAMTRD